MVEEPGEIAGNDEVAVDCSDVNIRDDTQRQIQNERTAAGNGRGENQCVVSGGNTHNDIFKDIFIDGVADRFTNRVKAGEVINNQIINIVESSDSRAVNGNLGTKCGVNSKNCKTGGAKSREPHTSKFHRSGQLYPVVSVS